MSDQKPQPERRAEVGGRLERIEPAFEVFGPLGIGAGAACCAALSNELTGPGALVAGWGLWQLSVIVVVFWKIATTKDD